MLIIVEGVDRTGKTTFCERVAESVGAEVMHWDRPTKETVYHEYIKPLTLYEPGHSLDLVIDRHYLGELVWPTIFSRKSLFTTSVQLDLVEGWLKQRGALGVFAWRNPQDLEDACADEPCAGQAATAQLLFEDKTSSSSLPWFWYTHGDLERTEQIVDVARAIERDIVEFST